MSLLAMLGFDGFASAANVASNTTGRTLLAKMGLAPANTAYIYSGLKNDGRNGVLLYDGDGTAAAQCVMSKSKTGGLIYGLAFAYADVFANTGVRNILSVGGTPLVGITSDHKLVTGTANTDSGITLNPLTFYYAELVISATGIQVWVNDTMIVNITQSTADGAVPMTIGNLAANKANGAYMVFLDVYSADTQGSVHNARLGPRKITTRLPTADVLKQFTPSTGTDHFACVNAQDSKYVISDQFVADPLEDTFTSNQAIPDGVTAVQPFCLANKEGTTGSVNFALETKLGDNIDAEAFSLTTTQDLYLGAIKTVLPGAQPIQANLGNLQFGVKVS